jgi:hypothetical protein
VLRINRAEMQHMPPGRGTRRRVERHEREEVFYAVHVSELTPRSGSCDDGSTRNETERLLTAHAPALIADGNREGWNGRRTSAHAAAALADAAAAVAPARTCKRHPASS